MNNYGSDPVSAIVETEATGETAEIFADIRATMEIPLLTSIWRTLVSIDGGLAAVWSAAKPLYTTGQPQAALASIVQSGVLPVLEPLVPGQLECAGVGSTELPDVRAIVDAYNRSNGMNMLALMALGAVPEGPPLGEPIPASPPSWPELWPLLGKDEIPPETWALVTEVNRFGAVQGGGGLATLWRHLAHWPGLLAVVHGHLAYSHRTGDLVHAVGVVHKLAQKAGARLAHLRQEPLVIPQPARQMVQDYVAIPGAVTRMVTMGHALSNWLAPVPE